MTIALDQLRLRPFTTDDLADVYQGSSDPEVYKYTVFGPVSTEDTDRFLRMTISEMGKVPIWNLHLAIVERASARLIGACALTNISSMHQEAELGYWLCRDKWSLGYGTLVAKALVHYGFSELKLHRVFAVCRPANKASARVLEKAAMKREGHLREHRLVRGKWEDSFLYSVLVHEWDPGAVQVRIEK